MKTIATQIDSSVLPQRSYLNAQEIEQHWKKFPESEWKVFSNITKEEFEMKGLQIRNYMKGMRYTIEMFLARFTFISI